MFDHIAGGNQTYAVFSFTSRQDGNDTYIFKDSSGEVVGEYSPSNAFTYLIVAGDELSPGEYTFWKGDTQLKAGSMPNMNGGMPQGERPEMPNGEHDMLPEIFDDQERPERPNGEHPTQDMPPETFDGQERPEMFEDTTPPNHIGGMMGGNMMQNGEASDMFIIVKGGNQFANVSPEE